MVAIKILHFEICKKNFLGGGRRHNVSISVAYRNHISFPLFIELNWQFSSWAEGSQSSLLEFSVHNHIYKIRFHEVSEEKTVELCFSQESADIKVQCVILVTKQHISCSIKFYWTCYTAL